MLLPSCYRAGDASDKTRAQKKCLPAQSITCVLSPLYMISVRPAWVGVGAAEGRACRQVPPFTVSLLLQQREPEKPQGQVLAELLI